MSTIALFHPSFGITEGIKDAERRLQAAGHDVHVIDYYGDGQTFTDYDVANQYVDKIGFPVLMQRALSGVSDLPDGFIAMGFSNGAGMATYVALNRIVDSVILCSGALPIEMLGAKTWPNGTSAQLHYMLEDPKKVDGSVESVMRSVNQANADAEYLQYPGDGHLFTDSSQKDEYDQATAERLWLHVLRYLS